MRTALLLDDDRLVLKLGKALLEEQGFIVATCESWVELSEVVGRITPAFALIDVNMPSMRGDRLVAIMKSARRNVFPIFLMSDLPASALEDLATASGADAWLQKPLTREKIAPLLAQFA